jgi:adenylate cyclase
LSKFSFSSELPLISRQASFALKGQTLAASEISIKLQARYVVTGQVQVTGGTTHWALEMLDGETNRVVWSENAYANFGNVEAELDALLQRIAGTIHNHFLISRLRRAPVAALHPEGPFNDYLKVTNMIFRSTPESAVEAQRMSAAYVAERPDYAPAWACHFNAHLWDLHHCLTGLWKDDRIAEMLAEINTCIALDPTYANSYGFLAQALCFNGQFEEAEIAMRKAQDLAPREVVQIIHRAHVYFFSGRLEEALHCAEEALGYVPTRPGINMTANRGRALVFLLHQGPQCAWFFVGEATCKYPVWQTQALRSSV